MNILEYENYQEKISHGNPLFPYITYLCSIHWIFRMCRFTGMTKWSLSI